MDTAVRELFDAFRGAPLPDHVDYCDHCVDPAQVEELRVTPLRELTAEQLGPLLFNAMSTWGDVAYFRHFLPRLLELVAAGAMEDWSWPSFLPARLARCWATGTEHQRAAVADFLRAWWTATMSRPDLPGRPRDVLEVIDGCGLPLTPFLDMWSTAPGEAAARQAADFVADCVYASQGSERMVSEIDRWLRGAVPAVLLDRIADPAWAGERAEALDLLAFYQAQPADGRTPG